MKFGLKRLWREEARKTGRKERKEEEKNKEKGTRKEGVLGKNEKK